MTLINRSPYTVDLERVLEVSLANSKAAIQLLNLINYGSVDGIANLSPNVASAAVKTLNTVPVTVIPAIPGKAIIVTGITLLTNAGVAYDGCAGKTIAVRYAGSIEDIASLAADNADLNLDSASLGSAAMPISGFSPVYNAAIQIDTSGSVFTAAGNKDLTIQISYYAK